MRGRTTLSDLQSFSMARKPTLAHAKRMRRAPSVSERLLWNLLRARRLERFKFRRQVPLGRYIVDFACMRHRLIVEADGPFHDELRDAIRDAWLAAQGFKVLRFPNSEIITRPENVLMAIIDAVPGAAPTNALRPMVKRQDR